MPTKPITYDAAIRRIHAAGLNITSARAMSDNDLLRFPSIGRRTLAFIRDTRGEGQPRFTESAPLLAYLKDATREDATTRALDSATRAAQIESRKAGIAVRIALVALIPSILLCGIIGAAHIVAGN